MRFVKYSVLILLVGLLLLCGCDKYEDMVYDEELPKIVVGGDYYPPFNYIDADGMSTGIYVDVAKEAFRRIGYKPEFVEIQWEDKQTLLENGKLDCIWGCFSVNDCEKDFRCTSPYMYSRQVVAVDADSRIQHLSDLRDKTIAVHSTVIPEEIFFKQKDNRIPPVKEVFALQDREMIYTYLGKGYVDAIATHEAAIRQYMDDSGMEYKILDETLVVSELGVAFSKNDNRGIEKELSRVFEDMKNDGTMQSIIDKYFGNSEQYLGVTPLE